MKKVKLHLACGTVYLRGYVNIDAKGLHAATNKKLVAQNTTDINHYYKTQYVKKIFGHDKRGKIVCDMRANILSLPEFENNSVDEILNVNVIDHLKFQDLPEALEEWRRILKPQGILIIDVGDIIGNAKLLLKAKTRDEIEWALRLIYCHSRDKYDSHHWGYFPKYLKDLMKQYGFSHVWTKTDYIKHVYPSFQSGFKKAR